jgi:hypothetical protein
VENQLQLIKIISCQFVYGRKKSKALAELNLTKITTARRYLILILYISFYSNLLKNVEITGKCKSRPHLHYSFYVPFITQIAIPEHHCLEILNN